VWRDFEAQELNEAAAEWIWPGRQGDAAEPWVFLVGADGNIVQRWDNVATEGSLAGAVEALVGG
jgi:peroxiredoxin